MIQFYTPPPTFKERIGAEIGQGIKEGIGQARDRKYKGEAETLSHERELGKLSLQGQIQKEIQQEKYGYEKELQKEKYQLEGQKAKETKPTPFEQEFQKKMAGEYFTLQEDIDKIDASEQDLDYIQKELAPEARSSRGLLGTATGGYLGSGAGKELDTVAHAQLQPVIKVFNKAGPLAQKKLELLQNIYIPKSTDSLEVINRKIDGLRRLNKRTREILSAKKEYIENMGGIGSISPQMMNRIDDEVYKGLNSEVDMYNTETNDQVTGLVGAQNGKKLKPMSRQQATQLIEQGLATYG